MRLSEYLALFPGMTWCKTRFMALVEAVLPAGVTLKDNDNGTVTVSSIGTKKELLPVPAEV